MRVFLIGAGQVGSTIVEALHEDHEITVLDTEAARLQALTGRFDVAVFEGDGTSRKDLAAAGIRPVAGAADLDAGAAAVRAVTVSDEVAGFAGVDLSGFPASLVEIRGRREKLCVRAIASAAAVPPSTVASEIISALAAEAWAASTAAVPPAQLMSLIFWSWSREAA